MKKKLKNYLKSVVLLISFVACSTSNYNSKNRSFYSIFKKGEYERAAKRLEDNSKKDGKDQILYLLDRGTALFEAGDYKQAIKVFTKAEKYTEYKEDTPIDEKVVSILTSDATKIYRPMDYETIMINVYLALSYLMLEKYESAMVECRRINNLVYRLKTQGLKSYEESPFAWYLSASIYESQNKFDDARIDYNRAKKLNSELKLLNLNSKSNCSNCGTVIVIYSDQLAPKKVINPINKEFPAYKRSSKPSSFIKVYNSSGDELARSYIVMDVQKTAIKNLRDRLKLLKNRKLAASIIKGAIAAAAGVASKDKDVGIATYILLELLTRTKPDTRSWATLPRNFQVARFSIPEGYRFISLVPFRKNKKIDDGKIINFNIKRDEFKFFVYRYID